MISMQQYDIAIAFRGNSAVSKHSFVHADNNLGLIEIALVSLRALWGTSEPRYFFYWMDVRRNTIC
jgi:hypothetical protein